MKKVMLVCYGGGHLQLLIPVMKELEKREQPFVVLALTVAYEQCKKLFPQQTRRLLDYVFLFEEDLESIKELGSELVIDNHNPDSGIDLEESIFYLGLSMHDLLNQYGVAKAGKYYAEKGRHCFLPIFSMKKILNFEQPKVVVSTTSPRFELSSIYAANQLKIKTLQILDLFGDITPLPSSDYLVCMNDSVKNTLIERGLKESQIFPFGQPAIEDTVRNIESIDKMKLRKRYVKGKTRILLFASQRPIEYDTSGKFSSYLDYQSVNDNLCRVLGNIETKFDIKVLIRIHPNERKEDYELLLNKFDCLDLNLYESLALADIVVTSASTIAIEAVVTGSNVFTFSYDEQKYYPINVFKEKPFIFSNGYKSLEFKLRYFLANDKKEKANHIQFLCRDSAIHIVNLIEGIKNDN